MFIYVFNKPMIDQGEQLAPCDKGIELHVDINGAMVKFEKKRGKTPVHAILSDLIRSGL